MVRIKDSSFGVEPGIRFGKWLTIGKPFSIGKDQNWRIVCICDCGSVAAINTRNLAKSETKSCRGCYDSGRRQHHHRLKRIWNGMYSRCYRDYDISFHNYGGRGISICQQWLESFDGFANWAIENGYESHLEIDRENTDGNYCPENCRWVTRKANSNNKRTSKKFEAFGESKTVAEWFADDRCVVCYETLRWRLAIAGACPERSITQVRLKDKYETLAP